jgi:uncharacterized membrane protein YgdD (TMEM256/DUF423 family)
MRKFFFMGAFFCFLGVLAGVLRSHALKKLLTQINSTANFSIATDYMFYHGMALILVALMEERYPRLAYKYVGWLFVAGCILFQGNLYILSLTGASPLGFLTPVGGLCLLIGWLLLAVNSLRIAR